VRAGHVSVIVGGSQGIGRALAVALARRGGSVVAVGRNRERLAATLAELRRSGPGVHTVEALDVSVPGQMDALAAACGRDYGHVDLLVVSAAVAGYETEAGRLPPSTRDLPLAAWQRALDVNLHGVFLANRAFLPMMLARGAGDILNIGSALTPHGMRGKALAPGYSASKFAVAAFTRALAAETAETGVRVNALFPGTVDTPLIAGTMLDKAFGGRIRVESFAESVIAFLQAGEGAFVPDPYILPMPTERGLAEPRKELG
jgi:3-oxoacyl-[acyl-carrier protein] reductase